jgi:hypothetical protein
MEYVSLERDYIIYYADIYYQYIFHACCFFKDKLKTKIVVWINCQLILITRAKFIRKLIKDSEGVVLSKFFTEYG